MAAAQSRELEQTTQSTQSEAAPRSHRESRTVTMGGAVTGWILGAALGNLVVAGGVVIAMYGNSCEPDYEASCDHHVDDNIFATAGAFAVITPSVTVALGRAFGGHGEWLWTMLWNFVGMAPGALFAGLASVDSEKELNGMAMGGLVLMNVGSLAGSLLGYYFSAREDDSHEARASHSLSPAISFSNGAGMVSLRGEF